MSLKDPITLQDRMRFLDEMKEIHGNEFAAPESLAAAPASTNNSAGNSMFALYREAIGAPVELIMSDGQRVIIAPPRIKTLKYLLAKANTLQEMAEKDPTAVLVEFEKIMLQCLEFPDGGPGNRAELRAEWFDNLPGSDGLQIPEHFNEVFNIQILLSKAGTLGKK